jgi:hypothetical protein
MTTVFLYVFVFSTWGLGIISWLALLGGSLTKWELERQEKVLDLEQKKLMFGRFNSLTSGKFPPSKNQEAKDQPLAELGKDMIPEKIRELMKSSPMHPEVEEIDSTDEILGVRFEAENYPPGFGDDEE